MDAMMGDRKIYMGQAGKHIRGTISGIFLLCLAHGAQAQVELGACCLPGFTCTQTTQAACEDMLGSYEGAGSFCFLECNIFAQKTCCTPNVGGQCCSCSDVEQWGVCQAQGGAVAPGFTSCLLPGGVDSVCGGLGACCTAGGCQQATFDDCFATLNGQAFSPQGDCATAPCDTSNGLCCYGNGQCTTTFDLACSLSGGTFLGPGLQCQDVDDFCQLRQGACCNETGSCVDTTPTGCGMLDDLYQGDGTTCASFTCPITAGACCDPFGDCIDGIAQMECVDYEIGEFLGVGTLCSDANVDCFSHVGGCCMELDVGVFDCEEVTQTYCSFEAGTYYGDQVMCFDTNCEDVPPTLGGCCVGDACFNFTEAGCNTQGGVYQGDFTVCSGIDCTGGAVTGACCQVGDVCTQLSTTACAAIGGIHQGDAVACALASCPEFGRCCLSDFSCVNTSFDVCSQQLAGVQFAPQSLCENFPCPPIGACCSGTSCFVTTQSGCEATATNVYQGDMTTCANAVCVDCVGIGDCFSANGSPSCDDAECCANVCLSSPQCCDTEWTQACADQALLDCTVPVLAGPLANPDNCHHYFLLDASSWTDAQQTAQVAHGADLATIDDAAENAWVRANPANLGAVARDLWIGYTDQDVEGTFAWSSGAPFAFENWNAGEPSASLAGEDYAKLLPGSGLWNSVQNTPPVSTFGVVEVPSRLPGDDDCNGRIDLSDYPGFPECMAGPGKPPNAVLGVACLEAFDIDGDGDVDAIDAALLQIIFTGP